LPAAVSGDDACIFKLGITHFNVLSHGYGSSTVPLTSCRRSISWHVSVTVKSMLVKPEPASIARIASSIFCCEVTPTDFKNFRIERLKLSSLMAVSCVMIPMTVSVYEVVSID
jgi:hypothetical protein